MRFVLGLKTSVRLSGSGSPRTNWIKQDDLSGAFGGFPPLKNHSARLINKATQSPHRLLWSGAPGHSRYVNRAGAETFAR